MKSSNLEFAKQLQARTKRFAVSIFQMGTTIKNSVESNALRSQLFRSASSIVANYREANRAKSRSDFRNKIRICEGEAAETQYWLEIIRDLELVDLSVVNRNYIEVSELLAIFTSISNKVRVSNKV